MTGVIVISNRLGFLKCALFSHSRLKIPSAGLTKHFELGRAPVYQHPRGPPPSVWGGPGAAAVPRPPPRHQSGRAGRGVEESEGKPDPRHLCVCRNLISPSQDNGSCFASSSCKLVFWPIPNSELYRAVYSGKKDPT